MSVILNKAYFDLNGTFQEDLSTIYKVSGGSNLTTQFQGVSPFPNDYNCQITITNEFGKNVGWLSATYLETVDIESGTYEGDTWNSWYYNVQQSVLAEVSRLSASKLYYQFRWREEDTNYQSSVTATVEFGDSGYEATIDAQLEAILTATGNTDKWFLVTDTAGTTHSFTSDGTSWNDDGYEKPIYPTVHTSDMKEIPITPTLIATESTLTNSELTIIQAWLTSLSADVVDLQTEIDLKMNIADYDTDGTATKSVKYARNVGTSTESVDDATVITKLGYLNQSVKTTDDVVFNSVTTVDGNVDTNLALKEDVANKVTSFSTPTDDQYPSAKLTSDQLDLKEDVANKVTSFSSPTDDEYPSALLVDTKLDAQKFLKVGWPLDIANYITITFDNGTRTLSLSTSTDVDYYIDNTKLTLEASTPKTATITDTEGLWFFKIDSTGTLLASQTAWEIESPNYALVSYGYWDATNNTMNILAYEMHSYDMPVSVHRDLHNGVGTVLKSGGVVTDSGSDTLNCTAPLLLDEDIKVQVVDGAPATGKFYQELTPLQSYKYYRDGASGNLRRVNNDTTPFYLISNKVQLNPYSGGVYSLTPMTNNKYGAYWVIHTTDIENPVKIFLGQAEADTLDDAIENNGLASMNFGSLPLQEQVIAYRIIVQQTVSSPYYSIEQIDDFTIDRNIGTPASAPTSHGALSGLLEDDHTQYFNSARLASATELDVRYYTETEMDTKLGTKVDLVLYNDASYVVLLSGGADGTEYLYVDKAGTKRKMTLDEVATYANTATGAFVPSGQYQSDGLGAFRSATVEIAQGTLNTGAQVYVDIRTVAQNVIYYVQMPTISSTNDLELSVDNQTTYYDVLFEGQNVQGADVSGKLIKVTFDGTQFNSMEAPSLVKNIPYTGANGQHTIGANGIGHAITKKANTAPTDIRGRTIEQFVIPTLSGNYTAQNVTDLGGGEFYFNGGAGVDTYINRLNVGIESGVNLYVSAYCSEYTSGIVNFNNNASYPINAVGKFSYIIPNFTSNRILVDDDTALVTDMKIKDIQYIPLPSDITTVAEAEAMLDGTVLSQGLHSVGQARTYATADYPQEIQDYIEADGTVAGDTIKGVYTLTTGKNKFDKSQGVNVGYARNSTTGELSVNASFTATELIAVVPSENYRMSGMPSVGDGYFYNYDRNGNFIDRVYSSSFNATYAVPSDTYYTSAVVDITTNSVDVDTVQLELGTSATTYEPYEYSVQHTDGVLYGIGGVYDDEYTQRFARDYNDVVQSATGWTPLNELSNTIRFLKVLNTSLDYKTPILNTQKVNIKLKIGDTIFNVDTANNTSTLDMELVALSNDNYLIIRVNKSRLSGITSADFEAYLQANDVEFIYELDTYLPRTIDNANLIPINGTHIVSPYSTWHSYGGGLVPQFDMKSAYSLAGQLDINVDTDIQQGKVLTNHESRLDKAESEIGTLQTDVGDVSTLDTTSKEVVGAINEVHGEVNDHLADTTDAHDASAISYVNTTSGLSATEVQSAIDEVEGRLDTAESNATSAKTKTDFITVTQNVNLDTMESDIATNNAKITYPSADSTKVGYLSVTSAINLDKVAEWTDILSGTVSVSNATTKPSSNITLSSAYSNYDIIAIVFQVDTGFSNDATVTQFYKSDTVGPVIPILGADLSGSEFKITTCYISFDGTTAMTAWYASEVTVIGGSVTAISDLDIINIYGIKL